MTVNHGVPGSSPGEGAKATNVGWLFCYIKIIKKIESICHLDLIGIIAFAQFVDIQYIF